MMDGMMSSNRVELVYMLLCVWGLMKNDHFSLNEPEINRPEWEHTHHVPLPQLLFQQLLPSTRPPPRLLGEIGF